MREPWWSRRLTNVLLINICCGRASRSLLRPPSALAGCGVAALRPSRPARPGPAPQGVAALEADFGAGAGAGILMVSQYSLRFSRFSHPFRLSRSAWVVPERRAWITKGHRIGDFGGGELIRGSGQAPGGPASAPGSVEPFRAARCAPRMHRS